MIILQNVYLSIELKQSYYIFNKNVYVLQDDFNF
jgi:hypothetical protein